MNTIDTHSHFNLHQFDDDRDESIARMQEAGVGTICVGIDEQTSALAVEFAHAHESIWACVGQHPTEWEKQFDETLFEKLSQEKRVVAIGECGLDYFREKDREGKPQQRELFQKQIKLAHKYNLPLMLHIRPDASPARQGLAGDAYEDALDMLEVYQARPDVAGALRGTAHFFAGSTEVAQRFLDVGFYISFSGVITFVKEYEEVVRYVPLERILPETDAPFAAPVPHRGKRNNPEYVLEVVRKIAEIKGLTFEETQNALRQNVTKLFGI